MEAQVGKGSRISILPGLHAIASNGAMQNVDTGKARKAKEGA
jgi:hypothetical protein